MNEYKDDEYWITKDFFLAYNVAYTTSGEIMIQMLSVAMVSILNLICVIFFGGLLNLAAVILSTVVLVWGVMQLREVYNYQRGFLHFKDKE